jgi:hypothetical protein
VEKKRLFKRTTSAGRALLLPPYAPEVSSGLSAHAKQVWRTRVLTHLVKMLLESCRQIPQRRRTSLDLAELQYSQRSLDTLAGDLGQQNTLDGVALQQSSVNFSVQEQAHTASSKRRPTRLWTDAGKAETTVEASKLSLPINK